MVELSKKEKFTVKIVSPFLRENQKIMKYLKIKQQKKHKLEKIFKGYFDKMSYLELGFFQPSSNHYKIIFKNKKSELELL